MFIRVAAAKGIVFDLEKLVVDRFCIKEIFDYIKCSSFTETKDMTMFFIYQQPVIQLGK